MAECKRDGRSALDMQVLVTGKRLSVEGNSSGILRGRSIGSPMLYSHRQRVIPAKRVEGLILSLE